MRGAVLKPISSAPSKAAIITSKPENLIKVNYNFWTTTSNLQELLVTKNKYPFLFGHQLAGQLET